MVGRIKIPLYLWLSENGALQRKIWIPAFAGMTNRSYQIQVNLNLVANFVITAAIEKDFGQLETIPHFHRDRRRFGALAALSQSGRIPLSSLTVAYR